jgi:7-carboxy-7-deazaguanine synthase
MNPDNKIAIHERFHAFQGEGVHSGRSAFFIRTFGCPVHCPWCDSAGTWHKDYTPKAVERLSVAQLATEAAESCAAFTVITGGEPCVQPHLPDLCDALRSLGMLVHLETCGAFDVDPTLFDHITVSPKRDKPPTKHMIEAAAELKIIVDEVGAIAWWVEQIKTICGGLDVLDTGMPVYLHPEWSQRDHGWLKAEISARVTQHGDPFRAGYQMHKLFNCDALDERTRELAPLGGDPARGY